MKTSTPELIPSRLDGLVLKTGCHPTPGSTQNPSCDLCAMEAAAYIYGFEHSDRDEHACPIIGSVVRVWNDREAIEAMQHVCLRISPDQHPARSNGTRILLLDLCA